MFSDPISSRKRDLMVRSVMPRTVRRVAFEIWRCFIERVIPTNASRRSSSSSSLDSWAREWGRVPSSRAIIATAGNSRPLDAWRVMRVTAPDSESTASASAMRAMDSRYARTSASRGGTVPTFPDSACSVSVKDAGSSAGSNSRSNSRAEVMSSLRLSSRSSSDSAPDALACLV